MNIKAGMMTEIQTSEHYKKYAIELSAELTRKQEEIDDLKDAFKVSRYSYGFAVEREFVLIDEVELLETAIKDIRNMYGGPTEMMVKAKKTLIKLKQLREEKI